MKLKAMSDSPLVKLTLLFLIYRFKEYLSFKKERKDTFYVDLSLELRPILAR